MKISKNIIWLIALTLQINPLTLLPASGLQVTTLIDMSAPVFNVKDLDTEDGIDPEFTLSNLTSNAGWSLSKQKFVGDYFTQLVDYRNTPLVGWTNDFSDSKMTSGGTSNVTFSKVDP